MRKSLQCKQLFSIGVMTCIVFFMLIASFTIWSYTPSYAAVGGNGRHTLPGHLVPALKRSQLLGHATNKNQQLQLSIGLNIRNRTALTALIAAQNDPTSALYHQFLTPQQFTDQFGPTQTMVNSVIAYSQSQGLKVNGVSPNHVLVNASGSVGTVEQAFRVTLNDYVLNGRTVYAPSSEPSVPDTLGTIILNVAGLDNVARYQHAGTIEQKQSIADAIPGYTPDQLRTAYDANALLHTGSTGAGQTLALFELDGYTPSDVNAYLSHYNLGTPKYSDVLVDGATNTPGDGAIEVELDMQVASALAPDATQKIYIGQNTPTGINDLYNKIVTDDQAKGISTSWGVCETFLTPAELSTLDVIFAQGAAQGQALFAASGDAGAYDCYTNTLAVESPADDPYVVGVGGTSLHVKSDGTYGSEAVWEGSGGGISTQFTRPAYQKGTNLTNSNRMVPDVSADADRNTGYSTYCTVTASDCTGWMLVGGTSAAAPLWAGIATDINEYLISQVKPSLGSASGSLYALYNKDQPYSAYHDVTTGNNHYYSATPGYDTASGIGTPDVWNLARDVASLPPVGTTNTTQLLSNGNFDRGPASWSEYSAGNYEIVDDTRPHAGGTSADLCGYAGCNDRIYQTVILPASSKKIVFSYWVYVSTQETTNTCVDTFFVRLRTVTGSTVAILQMLCNTTAAGWKQYTFDVSSVLKRYAGKRIEVSFEGKTITSGATEFFVDDVALTATHA